MALHRGYTIDKLEDAAEVLISTSACEYVGLTTGFAYSSAMSIDESRVTLRPFTPEDLPQFLEWATDDEVTAWLTWDTYTSEEDAARFLHDVAIPHPWLRAICVDGTAAGSIVVERGRGVEACRGLLGYCLARRHWGQGVGTVAARKMVAMAFQGMDVARIEALVEQRNVASRRVLEKAGFQLEGTVFKYVLVKGRLLDCFLFATYAPEISPP